LHLAVESGAAPEVVNLIIVANWSAIVAQDQSGRDPTEILDTMELLQLDDYRIVHESLTRCYKAYTKMQKVAQEEQSAIKKQHKAEFSALTRRHHQEVKKEQDTQEEIRHEVRVLESRTEDMKEVERAKDHAIKKFHREKDMWIDQIESLGEMIKSLKEELSEEKNYVEALVIRIEGKDEDILSREDRIETLSNDLRNVAVMHDDQVMESLIATEHSMRAMVSNHIALQKNLSGQANGLKALLSARGIPLPEEELLESDTQGEEMKSPHQEETLDPAETASAVMAAAVAALQKPPAPIQV
jgi:chromosome segregation ATPase